MIVTRTPFRISFFGGGTDYPEYFERHGGAVLATAIDKSFFLSVTKFYSELFDYSIRFAYSKVECAKTLDDMQHTPLSRNLTTPGDHSRYRSQYRGGVALIFRNRIIIQFRRGSAEHALGLIRVSSSVRWISPTRQ